MIDTQFYNGFIFHIFQYEHYSSTDWMKPGGCRQHYLARMISGTAKICTHESTLHLKAGDVFYIPKGLQYRSHWYPENDKPVRFYSFGFDHFHTEDRISYPLQLISCTVRDEEYLAELESDLSVSLLSIGRLYRFLGAVCGKMQIEKAGSHQQIINRAMEYMRENTGYTIGQVARHCGVSESSLYGIFARELHQTPVQAKHRILAQRASLLLRTTDLSIEDISAQLGFSSSSYLRKVLGKETGMSPSQIRKGSRQI